MSRVLIGMKATGSFYRKAEDKPIERYKTRNPLVRTKSALELLNSILIDFHGLKDLIWAIYSDIIRGLRVKNFTLVHPQSKTTSKTQRLLLKNTKVNINFNSQTKFPLDKR